MKRQVQKHNLDIYFLMSFTQGAPQDDTENQLDNSCLTRNSSFVIPSSYNSCTIHYHFNNALFSSFYITIILISIPANLFSLYVSYKQIKRKNELGVYLLNLSLADLMYTMVLPIWVDFALKDVWSYGIFICQLCVFVMYTNIYSSAAFLCCISLDRYLAVVHPLRYFFLRTVKNAGYISVIIWATGLLCNVLILNIEETYTCEEFYLICFDLHPLPAWKAKFNFIRFFAGFLLPSLLIMFCCQGIYRAVKSNRATVDCEKRKINKLLFSIMIMFLFCFAPFHVIMVIRSALEQENCDFAQILFYPHKISVALSALNCVVDPFLYCFVSTHGRMEVLNIVLFRKKCSFSSQGKELEPTA
uniref:G protein-coupled receptor 65 n=1 Tax=Lepisosteus oculatus TaxID=7918 RepID=W5MPM5_LEPOC|nr:PREDICTED: psychosine receptor [Lepisosteus oculatus]